MNIKVTGTCAMPTKTGLLYGCTSTGVSENYDGARRLPNGVYVMYNSTEEMDANGNWRKLSTRFYNFTIG